MFFGRDETIDQLNGLLKKRVASLVRYLESCKMSILEDRRQKARKRDDKRG